jgi:hypothetical protein
MARPREQFLADDELKNGVSEEFESLVVLGDAGVFVPVGGMRDGGLVYALVPG